MALKYVERTATADEIATCVREHGCVIIDELVPVELMDRIETELQPYFDSTAFGHLSELGFATQRTGSLIARSPSVHELILQETYLGAVKHCCRIPPLCSSPLPRSRKGRMSRVRAYLSECLVSVVRKTQLEIPIPRRRSPLIT